MPPETEWHTRKQRIDARLSKLGWRVIPFSPALDLSGLDAVAVEEFPTAHGPADYALWLGGKLLGLIEAKKVAVNPQNVPGALLPDSRLGQRSQLNEVQMVELGDGSVRLTRKSPTTILR
jgi:hypothetical protein